MAARKKTAVNAAVRKAYALDAVRVKHDIQNACDSMALLYAYRVSWSPEDQAFIATVDEWPSLSALDGQSPDRAVKALCRVVAACMRDMSPEESYPKPSLPLVLKAKRENPLPLSDFGF